MSFNPRAAASILALLALAAPATAQEDASDPPTDALPRWVEDDPFSSGDDDPLGIDRGDRLERVEPTTVEEEVHRRVPVDHGEVLHAIAGVREIRHDVEVRLGHGLARVDVRMRFRSSARYAAELRYRLAVPDGASLARLEVCNARGCRQGRLDESAGPLGPYDDAVRSHAAAAAPLPVAHATLVEDRRGAAIRLRAAPVPAGRSEVRRVAPEGDALPEGVLELRVRYVVDAPVRGGAVRLALPERGRDDRTVAASIRVRSDELSGGAVDGVDAVERPVERAAWEPAEISARLTSAAPEVQVEAWRVPCGEGRCARLRAVAAPRPPRARELILLLDASPSTAGPARGRLAPAVAALLSALPSRARVRVAVFAARAEAVVAEPTAPTDVSLIRVSRALERELGSATRFEAAWGAIGPWVRAAREPLVLLMGDGGLTTGEEATAALRAARAAGARIASLNVADRPSTEGLRRALGAIDGALVDAGAAADRAARGHGLDPLRERMAALLSPVVEARVRARVGRRVVELGPLRAGEEQVWEGPVGRGPVAMLAPRARAVEPPAELALALRDRLERAAGRRSRPVRLAALAPDPGAPEEARQSRAPGSGTPGSGTPGSGTPGSGTPESEATCRVRGPFRSASAAAPRGARLVLADTRRCDRESVSGPPEEATAVGDADDVPARLRRHDGPRVLPEQSLLAMLRQRIIPVARGCFRDDRAGRASYQTRAVYQFRLADREVVDATVEGRIDAELRRCLARAIDDLDIPRFDGTVRVRYPIYTAPRLPPPTLSLDPDVADAVDAVSEGEE